MCSLTGVLWSLSDLKPKSTDPKFQSCHSDLGNSATLLLSQLCTGFTLVHRPTVLIVVSLLFSDVIYLLK